MGDTRTEFALQEVQGQIETGGDSRAGDQVAVVDDAGVDRLDPGGIQEVRTQVVGGGVAALDEAGIARM